MGYVCVCECVRVCVCVSVCVCVCMCVIVMIIDTQTVLTIFRTFPQSHTLLSSTVFQFTPVYP